MSQTIRKGAIRRMIVSINVLEGAVHNPIRSSRERIPILRLPCNSRMAVQERQEVQRRIICTLEEGEVRPTNVETRFR